MPEKCPKCGGELKPIRSYDEVGRITITFVCSKCGEKFEPTRREVSLSRPRRRYRKK